MERYELIIRFFREIGAEREAEMYLKLFHRAEPHRFAVIEVAEDLSGYSIHALALQLSFLSSLDLYPVVVHGAGALPEATQGGTGGRMIQADLWSWLAGSGSEARPKAGETAWQSARDGALALNETLTSTVILHEGDAEGLVSGVFRIDEDGVLARTDAIARAIRSDRIPVVAAVGTDRPGSSRSRSLKAVPLRAATRALVARLKPRKVIRISESSGLRKATGEAVEYVNLRLHAEALLADGALQADSAEQLGLAADLLEGMPPRTVFEICSASNLLRELFTQKGGGTLIKAGRALKVYDSFSGLSKSRLRRLIEHSFRKKLDRRYFTPAYERKMPIRTIIVDPDYKGMAIVRGVGGLDYLDKFAVRPEARGEGIATDLWTILLEHHPRIFWRSRIDNPINHWYFDQSTGSFRTEEWMVWWRGLTAAEAWRAVDLVGGIRRTLSP